MTHLWSILLWMVLPTGNAFARSDCAGVQLQTISGSAPSGSTLRVCSAIGQGYLCCAFRDSEGGYVWERQSSDTTGSSIHGVSFAPPGVPAAAWAIAYDADEENSLQWNGALWSNQNSDNRLLSLMDVWTGNGEAWVAGAGSSGGAEGTYIRRYDGQRWQNELWDKLSGIFRLVGGLTAGGEPYLWGIGSGRLVRRQSTGTWIEEPLLGPLKGLTIYLGAAAGPDDILLAGYSAPGSGGLTQKLLHGDGTRWEETPIPATSPIPWITDLQSLRSPGGKRYLAAGGGTTLQIVDLTTTPATWSSLPLPAPWPPGGTVYKAWVASEEEIWIVGYNQKPWVLQYLGGTWHDRTP